MLEEEQGAPVPLATLVKNILHSFFSDAEVYINNQQTYISNGLYAHMSYISNNFKGPSVNTSEFRTAKGMIIKIFLMNLWKWWNLYLFTRRMKMLSGRDGFLLYGKLGVAFFSTSELLYSNMKIRLGPIRSEPDLIFTWLVTITTVVLELLLVRFTHVVLLSRMIITRKEWKCLHKLLWSSTLQKF